MADTVQQQPIINPPVFAQGMTEQQCINHIRQVIKAKQFKDGSYGDELAPEKKNTNITAQKWGADDIALRRQLIIHWMAQGTPMFSMHSLVENLLGCSRSVAYEYVRDAMAYLSEGTEEYRDHLRDIQIAKLEQWAQECRDTGKYLEASKFTEQLNRLFGLYEKKIEMKSEGPIQITFGD